MMYSHQMTDPEKKGCWVIYDVPSTVSTEEFSTYDLTDPGGSVHRPDMVGKIVGSRVDGQEIEFEIQVPGEPVKRKARAPIDKAIDTHLKFQNRF